MYLRSGRFSADEVIGAWKAAISDAMYAGQFDVVRAVETWSRREVLPDMQELLMLESEMNRYLPLYPQVIVCLYDLDRFGSGALYNLVMTHPRMLMRGMLIENPYYLAPDEVLARTVPYEAASIAGEPTRCDLRRRSHSPLRKTGTRRYLPARRSAQVKTTDS
jgi:MEDS: MEthanogen/methylotroph, DcmR Sensory domain